MAKKRTTTPAGKAGNPFAILKKNRNDGKTIGQLTDAERSAWVEPLLQSLAAQRSAWVESIEQILAGPRSQFSELFEAMERRNSVEIPDWLESVGFPRDLKRAVQVALVEYCEFASSDEIDDCVPNDLIELIKIVVDKKKVDRHYAQWQDQRPKISIEQSRVDEPTDLLIDDALPGLDEPPAPKGTPGYLNIVLDVDRRTITRVGSNIPPIPLSNLQCELCKVFVAAESGGVTNEQLDQLPSEPNAPKMAISGLRQHVLKALGLNITHGRSGKNRILVDAPT